MTPFSFFRGQSKPLNEINKLGGFIMNNNYDILAKAEGRDVLAELAHKVGEINERLIKEKDEAEKLANDLIEMDGFEHTLFAAILQGRINGLMCKSEVLEGVSLKLKELFDELS
jgi:hypothetical protein